MSTTSLVPTPAGEARITYARAERPVAVLALGHGAGAGVESRDLQALASALPPHGVTVALVEQPWRVAGRRLAPAPKTLDAAWTALWGALAAEGLPVVAGGRSAGARVACRTGKALGAAAVLALAFPLHPPGRPDRPRTGELLAANLPTLVIQGTRDPFGHPEELRSAGYAGPLTPIPSADHSFTVPKRADLSQEEALTLLTTTVAAWLPTVL
jgi:uncharacterized protein